MTKRHSTFNNVVNDAILCADLFGLSSRERLELQEIIKERVSAKNFGAGMLLECQVTIKN